MCNGEVGNGEMWNVEVWKSSSGAGTLFSQILTFTLRVFYVCFPNFRNTRVTRDNFFTRYLSVPEKR